MKDKECKILAFVCTFMLLLFIGWLFSDKDNWKVVLIGVTLFLFIACGWYGFYKLFCWIGV